jgi:hypothetical protein
MDASERTIKAEIAKIQRLTTPSLSWKDLVDRARSFGDPADWTPEDWAWWRNVIEATVERVTILPSKAPRGSKKFDASRIEIESAVAEPVAA